jgi:type IV secretion system protein TrbL
MISSTTFNNHNPAKALLAWISVSLLKIAFAVGSSLGHVANKKKKTLILCVGVLFLLALTQANPCSPEDQSCVPGAPDEVVKQPTVPAYKYNGAETAKLIAAGFDEALNKIKGSKELQDARDKILGVGLSLMLMWSGIKTMMAGKGIADLLGEWIPLLLTAGLVIALTTNDGKNGGINVGEQIETTIDNIAQVLTKAASADKEPMKTKTVTDVVTGAVTTTFSSITNIIDIPRQSEVKLSLEGLTGGLAIFLFSLLMKAIASFVIVIAMCVYMATAIMSMVSIALVIALAPVMVPFLIMKQTAWLFDSWLKFLLGACMLKLVGAVMLALTSGLMKSMKEVASQIQAQAKQANVESYTGDLVLFSTLLLIAVMAGLLMAQVPSIATGLLAGSAGGAGFSTMKAVTNTAGAKVAAGSARATGNAVKGGVNALDGLYQRKTASGKAHKDAVTGGPAGGRTFSNTRAQKIYNQANKEASAVQAALGGMRRN